jgi:hypothetical protein
MRETPEILGCYAAKDDEKVKSNTNKDDEKVRRE